VDAKEGKISRGWRLTQVAWALIRSDRTMLLLALAGIVSATFLTFLVFFLGGYFSSDGSSNHLGLLALIALYPSTLLSVFFNVALACAASAAFDGERLTAGEAICMAYGKRWRIAFWSLIASVVGTLIAELANRLPGGARLFGWLLGSAWALATIFVVPILAMEGVGAVDALKRSSSTVKRRWGEGLTGNVSIGAWTVVVALPLCVVLGVGVALLEQEPGTGVVLVGLSVLGLIAVSVAAAATRQVFAVALYRYAIDAPIGGFAASDLEYPFTPAREKRKSWILRIGGPILGLFVLLTVIAAIVAPDPRTAAEGYFHVDYTPQQAAGLTAGAPVLLDGRQIGRVVSTEAEGPGVRIVFQVDPSLRHTIESTPAYVDHLAGRAYMRIGGPPPRAPSSPTAAL
jgi:Family of unknown function (DUF6159)